MLLEPVLVAPAFLQHPIDIATELPRRGYGRLGLPLRSEQVSIVGAHGARRQLQGLNDLDENPLEPVITRFVEWAVRRLAAGTARRGHEGPA